MSIVSRNKSVGLTVLFLLIILSCSEKDPYLVGFTSSLSGPGADLGEAGRNGVLLAVGEQNEKGGIRGRPVDIIIKDHAMDTTMLSHIAGFISNAGAEVIIGPFTSGMTKAILPVAKALGLIVISPTASSRDFLGIDDNLFRLSSSTTENTRYYADFLYNRSSIRNCAVIYDNQNAAFTKSWLNDFTDNYERLGGHVLLTTHINSKNDTDFSSELEMVLSSKAETLLIIANSIDSASLLQQFRQMDTELPVAVSEWGGTNQLIELAGKAAEGVVVFQIFDPFDESESYQTFHEKYLERFNSEPTFASLLSYDSCLVLFQALEDRNDGQTLKDAILDHGPFQGVQDILRINSFGDTEREAHFTIIRDGQFRDLE